MAHWFQTNVARELAFIKFRITGVENHRVRDFLLCVFSSIIVSVSNQESDTRYAAKVKNIEDGYTLRRFSRKLRDALERMKELSLIKTAHRNTPRVLTLDARDLDDTILPNDSIDLIVTSPPYPNSYDYYLYHKMRMYWLDYVPRSVQDNEIGSRHEHSSKKAPIQIFEEKMRPVLANIARVLKPSKLAYFFIGDAVIAGEHIQMGEVFRRIGETAGLRFVADNEYSLERVTRSFHEKKWSSNKHDKGKMQRIVVFEGVAEKNLNRSSREIAVPVASRKPIPLVGEILHRAELAIQADDSNRHIHSLGTYPSKFLPDIPRWAIEQFSVKGQIVMDPFVGAGTTSIEAIILSRNMVAADFSPYSCLLTKGKTTRVTDGALDKHVFKLLKVLASPKYLPNRRRLEFELDEFWFNPNHLREFERLRYYIAAEIPPSTRAFFLSVLATTIKAFSYLDAGQVKVKRDPKKVLSGTPSPLQLMVSRLPKYVERLKAFNKLADRQVSHRVINCSADRLHSKGIARKSVDLIVTSPPYINAMNYAMTHRYENLLLRLFPESSLIPHQAGYFGSERVYSEDYGELKQVPESQRFAGYLNPRLEQIFNKEPKRSYITYKYVTDMFRALRTLSGLLKPSGYLVIVAGTNVIRGVHIDTFNVLVTALEELGLTLETSFQYEIIKNAFKLRRHETANRIKMDGVAVMRQS